MRNELYVKIGHKNDMFFVCGINEYGNENIVQVFYSEDKANKYIEDRSYGDI